MADFGVTATGFQKMRLSDIQTDIQTTLRATLGNSINLLSESVFGQLVGIFADREANLWELAEDVYNAPFPDLSSGVPLDNAAAITNVFRLSAQNSVQQNLLLFGTAGSVIPAGTQVSVPGSANAKFLTNSAVTLVAGGNEVQTLTFGAVPAAGSFRLAFINQFSSTIPYNAVASDVAAALNSIPLLGGITVTGTFGTGFVITFAGNSGLQDQPLLVVSSNTLLDGSSNPVATTLVQTTAGIPQGVVSATATSTGAIAAAAYTLTGIDTPVSGLTRVLNQVDAVVGRAIETDNALKVRRRTAQTGQGKGTMDALRSHILALTGVTACIIFENTTLTTDGNGLPAKSFRAYAQGGADQDLWDTIWVNKPGGIYSDGTHVGAHVDTQGVTQTVRFERPTVIPIYISLQITRDTTLFPSNGAQQAKDALAAYINGLNIGDDVIVYPHLIAALNNIPGITGLQIGVNTSGSPSYGAGASGIVIAVNQLAQLVNETTDITVALV